MENPIEDQLRTVLKNNSTACCFGSDSSGEYSYGWKDGRKIIIRQTPEGLLMVSGKYIGICVCSIKELPTLIDLFEYKSR